MEWNGMDEMDGTKWSGWMDGWMDGLMGRWMNR